jgi:hypothetical protein
MNRRNAQRAARQEIQEAKKRWASGGWALTPASGARLSQDLTTRMAQRGCYVAVVAVYHDGGFVVSIPELGMQTRIDLIA